MRIVYSRAAVPKLGDRKFQNPRHFTAPIEGATEVFIDGNWPKIAEAYKAVGVSVSPLSEMRSGRTHPKKETSK